MTATTSSHLRRLINLWPDLHDALGGRTTIGAFGLGLRGYLQALQQHDATEAAALRALERSPDQIGARPVPISIPIFGTMRAVEAALAECADAIAAEAQIEPISFPGNDWPAHDRDRRHAAAVADLADPKRWRFRGNTPGARYTALWLLARIEHRPGPFRPLTETQRRHIHNVAVGAVARIESALDLADGQRELSSEHTCQCGGRIVVRGGNGADPSANCRSCGAIWSEAGIVAA
ncbi:hypothetical protein Q5762_07360 [Streptomyces sp. P9(2023)]|uniref:hypothetical protein n=1 Tax=Streptomyces sp. P9(2023) TaxID=3064394 RepID=UPI0028F45171|nr:hypothetical protein [Streptomyces sp. P9(2023)]MDT9688174.1 hypothetical protein [Streptomyces sp. P9(2023)]